MKLRFGIIILYYLLRIMGAEEDKIPQCFEGSQISKLKGNLDEDVTFKFDIRAESSKVYDVFHYIKECSESVQIAGKSDNKLKVFDQFTDKYMVEEKQNILYLTIFKLESKDFGNYLLRQNIFHSEVYLFQKEKSKYDHGPGITFSDSHLIFYILFGIAIIFFFTSVSLILARYYYPNSKLVQLLSRKKKKTHRNEDLNKIYDSNIPLMTERDAEQGPKSRTIGLNQVTERKKDWNITEEGTANMNFSSTLRYIKPKTEEDKHNYKSLISPSSKRVIEVSEFRSLPSKKEYEEIKLTKGSSEGHEKKN